MAGTICGFYHWDRAVYCVSMESGLDGRNNNNSHQRTARHEQCLNGVRPRWPEQWSGMGQKAKARNVSMESGLDGRNNLPLRTGHRRAVDVSMESGLDGRNNLRRPMT